MSFAQISNFSSLSFALFLCVSFLFFWSVPQKYKSAVLLLASYVFYASYQASHVFILITITLIDFYVAQLIYSNKENKKKVWFLLFASVVLNIGGLVLFKTIHLLGVFIVSPSLQSFLIPLGLSFFTLQSVGYILDVYRGKLVPEKQLIHYALFVSFFPQIIAGPIEKASEVLPQYKKKFIFKELKWSMIIYLFVYGYFKKYVVADNMAFLLKYISVVPSTPLLIKYLTLVLFFIRIYCDFSGYTNMARSIAGLFSVNLSENFNFPLFARSPQDFWDRWHMSLGRWIKNYFYLPVLLTVSNSYLAVLIVFPIMGLWHGPHLNFFIWGVVWAIFIIIFKTLKKNVIGSEFLQIFLMFSVSSILMIFYKVENVTQLQDYLRIDFSTAFLRSDDLLVIYRFCILPIFILCYEFWLFRVNDAYCILKKKYTYHKFVFYILVFILFLVFANTENQQIFYLQF